jgi:hypothetical protein
MKRVKFEEGGQRKFLQRVIEESGAPSLRALNQFGFEVPYSTLKNYFSEERNLPEDFFRDLCELSKIKIEELDVEFLDENYGQIKGGKQRKALR